MIVGGKHHKYAYNEREYVMAALTLYQDVINLFLRVLQILSKLDKENKRNQ
jgi:FtsH-binding integral membrane protein